jgi:hypothetical protein
VKPTKQQKIYAAFLGLAAVAFVCDRLFFLPSSASAASSARADTEPAMSAKAAEAPPPESNEPTLAVRLQSAASAVRENPAADPFSPRWHETKKTETKAAPVPAGQSPSEYFASKHRLTSLSAPQRGDGPALAQIGKKTYGIGDDVDGWKLLSVFVPEKGDKAEATATLESPAGTVVLKLVPASKGR